MTDQEWLECRRKGEALRAQYEQEIAKALIKSVFVDDLRAYIEGSPTMRAVDPPSALPNVTVSQDGHVAVDWNPANTAGN